MKNLTSKNKLQYGMRQDNYFERMWIVHIGCLSTLLIPTYHIPGLYSLFHFPMILVGMTLCTGHSPFSWRCDDGEGGCQTSPGWSGGCRAEIPSMWHVAAISLLLPHLAADPSALRLGVTRRPDKQRLVRARPVQVSPSWGALSISENEAD